MKTFISLFLVGQFLFYLSMNVNSTPENNTNYPKALVSFDDFTNLTNEVEKVRTDRLVNLETFNKLASEEHTIILDARSKDKYKNRHIKGAINLPFTEFTQDALENLIPNKDTRILIYCNNNFMGDQINFASKTFVPPAPSSFSQDFSEPAPEPKTKRKNKKSGQLNLEPIQQVNKQQQVQQVPAQQTAAPIVEKVPPINNSPQNVKSVKLALNIPTFINLYGYGYKNIYELNELVNINDSRVEFEGREVRKRFSLGSN